MRLGWALVLAGLALAGAGCAQEKEWMKVGQPYTTEEFHRDYAACSRGGRLDEACMRARGWVSVTPVQTESRKTTPDPRPPGRY